MTAPAEDLRADRDAIDEQLRTEVDYRKRLELDEERREIEARVAAEEARATVAAEEAAQQQRQADAAEALRLSAEVEAAKAAIEAHSFEVLAGARAQGEAMRALQEAIGKASRVSRSLAKVDASAPGAGDFSGRVQRVTEAAANVARWAREGKEVSDMRLRALFERRN